MKFLYGMFVGMLLMGAAGYLYLLDIEEINKTSIPNKDAYYSRLKGLCVTKGTLDTSSLISKKYVWETNGITISFDSSGERKKIESTYHGEKRGDTVVWTTIQMFSLNKGYMITDNGTRTIWLPNKGGLKHEDMTSKEIETFLDRIH